MDIFWYFNPFSDAVQRRYVNQRKPSTQPLTPSQSASNQPRQALVGDGHHRMERFHLRFVHWCLEARHHLLAYSW